MGGVGGASIPSFVYILLHPETEFYVNGYDAAALGAWATRVRRWAAAAAGTRDVVVYVDNDAKIRAPAAALALAERLGQTPRAGSAKPAASEITP